MADTLVLPYAERLVACLCAALADTVGGPPCRCSLVPGTAPPPADACCKCATGNGQASVQITDLFAFPIGKFPQRGLLAPNNCASFEWAAELTMVVYRCVSAVTEDGFPSGNELAEDARKIAEDAAAMREAVLCCDWRGGAPPPGRLQAEQAQVAIGGWKPLSPLGGCAGGMMSVLVNLGVSCCPPVTP